MTKNEKQNKNTKKKIIVICIALIAISLMSVFARYMLNRIDDFFTRAQEFYFYSDKLGRGPEYPVYQLESWGGTEPYEIAINMSSSMNTLQSATYDIKYDISVTCSGNVLYSVDKTEGIIYSATHKDEFTVVVIPNSLIPLKTGDMAYVEITVTANTAAGPARSPYEETLKARFNLVVGKESVDYRISDSPYAPYLELIITNTRSEYRVDTAFLGYTVGSLISREDYLELEPEDQKKCSSVIIEVEFDPRVLLLDMTNENYLRRIDEHMIGIGGYNYIDKMTFKVDAITATVVRFYKVDPTKNYSYPGTPTPVVQVTID